MTMSDPMFSSRERVSAYNLLDADNGSFTVGANRVTEQTRVIPSNSASGTLTQNRHVAAASVAGTTVVTENIRGAKLEEQDGVVAPIETLPLIKPSTIGSAAMSCSAIVLSEAKTSQASAGDILGVSSSNETTSGVLLLPPASSASEGFDLQEDHAMIEPLKQAYIFLSECNRQELRKIARRWNCPQGFTKGVLVAKLTMFVYEQVEKNKTCGVADILGAVDDWGFEGFLAQWSTVHSGKSFPSLATLQKLSRCNTKTDAEAALPELPKPSGKRKWRKTRMREREEALHGTCNRGAGDRHTVKRARSGGSDTKSGGGGNVAAGLQAIPSDAGHTRISASFTGSGKTRNGDENSIQVHPTLAGNNLSGVDNAGSPSIGAASLLATPVLGAPASAANAPDIGADVSALDTFHKMDVSERMMQYIKLHMGDAKGGTSAVGRGRGAVAVKSENGMLSSSGGLTRSDMQMDFETERKLLLELKQAKKEMEAAKGDKELEERWKAFADRIRKKLDSVGDQNTTSAIV